MSFEPQIRLPHTDLVVGRIGLGSSFGIGPEGLELAYDHGINYFYWGSIRRPEFARGIRNLARRGRERIVVALQSYARWPAALLRRSVERGLRRLAVDHADVLILGWYNRRPPRRILDAALELREKGRVRHLMMSGHRRTFFPEMAREDLFDLFMVRYNAVHRGAEREIFPALPSGENRPGICAYTATRWGTLIDPRKTPQGEPVPQASHCYRFCLLCGACRQAPALMDLILHRRLRVGGRAGGFVRRGVQDPRRPSIRAGACSADHPILCAPEGR